MKKHTKVIFFKRVWPFLSYIALSVLFIKINELAYLLHIYVETNNTTQGERNEYN